MNKSDIKKQIESIASAKELDAFFHALLGRKGSITMELRGLATLSETERRAKGASLNTLKQEVEQMFEEKSRELKKEEEALGAKKEWLDVSMPGLQYPHGHLNPLTLVAQQMEDIFVSMGFAIATGPELEDEWHNFDALNIPEDHPARDMWDTFWLSQPKGPAVRPDLQGKSRLGVKSSRLLLRTHTSPVQIRYMETHKPPFRIIAPGKVFRHEATDASHNLQFYHVEGLMVGLNRPKGPAARSDSHGESDLGKDVSIANFKGVIQEFFKRLLGEGATIRMRPSFFPFVEPGFEIDVRCMNCIKTNDKNCPVCHGTKWLEVMGAGMVHPKVFDAVRYNPEDVQGFAFGIGMDRIAMLKYKIDDIRLLYSGDMRFLKQF